MKKVNDINQIDFAKSLIDIAQSKENLAKAGVSIIDVRQKLSNEQFTNLIQVNDALNARMRMEQAVQELQLTKTRISLTKQDMMLRADQFEFDKEQRLRAANLADERFGLDKDKYDLEVEKFNTITKPNAELLQLQKTILNDQRNENLQAQKAFQDRLNYVTNIAGMPQMTVAQYKMLGNSPAKAAIDQLLLSGGTGLGFNVAAALDNSNNANFPLNDGLNIIRKKLTSWKTEAIAEYNHSQQGLIAPFNKLKPGEQNLGEELGLEKRINQEYSNIPDEGGIFSPAPLSRVTNIQAIEDLPLVQKLAPLAKNNPQFPTRAQDVFQTALTMVQKGEATPADAAAQIAKMYTAINLDNTAQRQYRTFKIQAPNKYSTMLFTGVGWHGSQIVDMTDPAQLQALLTRKAIQSINSLVTEQQNISGAKK